MKVLLLDIESSPSTAYVWSLFKETIPLTRLIDSSEVLCFSAKWYGKSKLMFESIHKTSPKKMLNKIHMLLSEADAVVTYNGNRFDIPTLNKEFVQYGMFPPAPFKQIDLYQTVKRNFRFPSNKLAYVSQALGLGEKIETDFKLWVDCMNHNPEAWAKMEAYNKHDVILLEKLYDKLRPWIRSMANWGLYSNDSLVCPNCGSKHWHKRGYAYTSAYKYQRYNCQDCGSWFKGGKNLGPKVKEKFVNV